MESHGQSVTELTRFQSWPSIARLNRDIVVTEKLDGTNAAVVIVSADQANQYAAAVESHPFFTMHDGLAFAAQSRSRFITPGKTTDNHGFAAWVLENREQLARLGVGRHFGEWWGKGIQRGYGLDHKRFSLFNTNRWFDNTDRPACCGVVPILHIGLMDQDMIRYHFEGLNRNGSVAAPGYMNPEGIVVYHTAAKTSFKWTFENDETGKGQA